jgi:hypothetical protein
MPGGWKDAAGGAATGATIGSVIPGVGTLIGGGIGALGGWLFGGDDDKKKDDEHPEDPYTKLLREHSDKLSGTGGDLMGRGGEALDPALSYLKKLLSNDPNAILDATRGERGRVIDQYDTARRAVAQFGPRGGGTNTALASSRFQQAQSLADITSDAKQDAVGKAAALGTSLTGLGLSAEQLASSDINAIINTVLTREGFDVTKRGQNMEALGGLGEALGTIIAAKMGGGS